MCRLLVLTQTATCAKRKQKIHRRKEIATQMCTQLTPAFLKAHCKENGGYGLPHLNDRLYLQFKGIDRLEGLQEYTGLRSIFLEGNGIERIEGLGTCTDLRCLYAQQNILTELSGLENLLELRVINVSNNNLTKLENLAHLPYLETLQASGCRIADIEGIKHLRELKSVTCLDLSTNKIDSDDPEEFLNIVASIPKLSVAYFSGNPVVSKISHYRKTMIVRVKHLAYLDDRPVFEHERRTAEAWARGGIEEERAERQRINDEKSAAAKRNLEYMQNIRDNARRERRSKAGLDPDSGVPMAGDWRDTDNFDSESDEEEEEPPELIQARQRLAHFEARPDLEEPPELSAARRQCAHAETVVCKDLTRPLQAPSGPDSAEAVKISDFGGDVFELD